MRLGRRTAVALVAVAAVLALVVANMGGPGLSSLKPVAQRGTGASRQGAAHPGRSGKATPVVSRAVKHDVSRPLRDISPKVAPKKWAFRTGQEGGEEMLPGPEKALESPTSSSSRDPVVQRSAPSLLMPATSASFDGISNASQKSSTGWSALPPDTNGDVGPNHYVQVVNVTFQIFNKSGASLYGPAAINTIWSGFGGACDANPDGDPVALYDPIADRWLMSEFALPNYPLGPFYECIAVSSTANPTLAWNRYAFKISNTKMDDYPKLGVWPDGYYMSTNQFSTTGAWAGAGAVAFERSAMVAGTSAQMVYFDLFSVDAGLGGMLPADLDGATLPPNGDAAPFVQFDDNSWGYVQDQLELWQFHVDWTTPANSTFTHPGNLATAPFDSNLCGYAPCIPQPGTAAKLDTLSDRLMHRLQYRNFGSYQTMVVNQTVDTNLSDRAGVRWYELRDSGGGWSVQQQGTFSPDSANRWMGSAAMDGDGNMAVGYSVSSGSVSPSIRYAGRLAGDPAGTLAQGEAVMVAGAGSQTDGSGRWGDYSSMSVDPSDDCTFWYTTEYYSGASLDQWKTRIGSFSFPPCPTSNPSPSPSPTTPPPPPPPPGGGGGSSSTSLSIKAPSAVSSGSKVTVRGKLSSSDPSCVGGKKLTLKGAGAHTKTSGSGAYRFVGFMGKTVTVQTVFKGTSSCGASKSAKKTIKGL